MANSKATKFALSNGVVVLVLTLLVGVYYFYSSALVRTLEDDRFAYRENFAWAVFQIQKQYLVLDREVRVHLNAETISDPEFDDIILKFDLLVSRVQIIQTGSGFATLNEIPELPRLLEKMQNAIAEIDAAVAGDLSRTDILRLIYQRLGALDSELQRASVLTTNYVSVYNADNIREVKYDIEILSYLFIIGVVVMVALSAFVVRNRSRAFEADMDARLARQEQQAVRDAAEYAKIHALGTLAGGVAHETNTPAQYIHNNLEFLDASFEELVGAVTMDPDGQSRLKIDPDRMVFMQEEIPAAIRESLQGLERIAEIVRGIRKFTYSGDETLQTISLPEEIETAMTLTRNQVKHIARFEQEYRTDVTELTGRRNHLSQALINLIVNAAQSIESKGRPDGLIHLLVTSDDDNVWLRVRDNGGGVPEEVRARIFDYFFTTKERGVGTGQGLPICRKLIRDDFGGDLMLSETCEEGAEFIIRLPRVSHRSGHIVEDDSAIV
ncbi:MAG: ATP-binding protein [Pseudomonadota bacterium]